MTKNCSEIEEESSEQHENKIRGKRNLFEQFVELKAATNGVGESIYLKEKNSSKKLDLNIVKSGKVPLCLEIVFFKIKNCITF